MSASLLYLLLLPRVVDPEADVFDAGLLSYLVQKNVEQLELSTPEARWQWYRLQWYSLQSSHAPNLCRFPVSHPGDVQATSHATEFLAPAPVVLSASPGPSVPAVSAEDVRSPGGSDSVVAGMVPQSRGAASHELVVFFQCGSKRYRVSARESMQVSRATSPFCKQRGFDEAKVQFYHEG